MPHVSISLQVYVLFSGVLTALIVAIGLLRAARRAGVSTRSVGAFLALGVLYLGITGFLAFAGVFTVFDAFPPRAALLIAVWVVTIVLLARSRAFSEIIGAIRMETLLEFQMFRFLAEGLIFWLILEGAMPHSMSFTGRNFDILIPLTAPLLALILYRRSMISETSANRIAIAWNVIGMSILTVTVVTGILSLPTPQRAFFDGVSTAIIFSFPFYILPAFWVGLAYSVHVFSLQKLWRERPM